MNVFAKLQNRLSRTLLINQMVSGKICLAPPTIEDALDLLMLLRHLHPNIDSNVNWPITVKNKDGDPTCFHVKYGCVMLDRIVYMERNRRKIYPYKKRDVIQFKMKG